MVRDAVTDDLMMRYLLADLSDDDQVWLEEHYFIDDGVFEQLLALEDELIDYYVSGELAGPQREQFELHFMISAERRQKLVFAEAFTQYLSTTRGGASTEKRKTWLQSITDWLGLRRATARWAFAAVCTAILFNEAWLVRENSRLHTHLREMQAQQTELRQREEQLGKQLSTLDLPAIEGTPGPEVAQSQPHSLPIVAFTLAPGLLRSDAEQKTLIIPPGPHLVRLRLDLESQSYESYLALLETAEGSRVWSKEGVTIMPNIGRRKVVLEVPSSLLSNNDYIIKLRGVRSGSKAEEIAAYSFRVVKR